MDSSNFSVRDSQKSDDFAPPYDEQEGKVRAIPFRDITSVGPAGSINSSVAEMARWVAVHTHGGKLDGKTIISPAVLDELHTPQMPMGRPSEKKEISPRLVRAGLDDRHLPRASPRGARGGIDGFTAETCLFPDDGMGLVVLTNKSGSPLPELITHHAADRLLGLEPIDWLAEALDQRKKARRRQEGGQEEERVLAAFRHAAGPPAGGIRRRLRAPRLRPAQGRAPRRPAGRRLQRHRVNLEHWHFEVFNAPKADNDPALDDLNWKLQFQTNLKGYVDAVAVPLEPKSSRSSSPGGPTRSSPTPSTSSDSRANTSTPGRP